MPLLPPKKRVWISYNHWPGGQIVVQKFDHETRRKNLGGDKTEIIESTPEEQIAGFEKSDFVRLKIGEKVVKNKVLIYGGPALDWDDPKAASKVIAWAQLQGMQAIDGPGEPKVRPALSPEQNSRIETIEQRVAGLEENQKADSAKIDQILAAVSGGKADSQ